MFGDVDGLAAPLLKPKTRDRSFATAAARIIGVILLVTCMISALVVMALPNLTAVGLLAYAFGARHGVDADHIAAIDNVTRRLVASGRRATTVGLFFSLGHCTVVLLLCVAVTTGAGMTNLDQLERLESVGSAVGPWVAAAVLITIGTINLCSARDFYRQWQQREASGHEHEIASLVASCCPALISAVDQPWKVLWIGLLFGLGLDTAVEIGMLTLTALAQPDVPRWSVMLLPLLFTAGMALVDSVNGLLMLWAYEWAADNGPLHRLYFSLYLTCVSALLALGIGFASALGQVPAQFPELQEQPFWGALVWVNENFEMIGLGAVGFFLASILTALLLARRCVPAASTIKEEADAKLKDSLARYVSGGEYIVRFE